MKISTSSTPIIHRKKHNKPPLIRNDIHTTVIPKGKRRSEVKINKLTVTKPIKL